MVTRQMLTKYKLISWCCGGPSPQRLSDALESSVPEAGLPLGRHVMLLMISQYSQLQRPQDSGSREQVAPLPSSLWPWSPLEGLSLSVRDIHGSGRGPMARAH